MGRVIDEHESARGHVTGAARYTEDLTRGLAQVLHASPVLSPHAHAELVALDPGAARDMPGFVRLLTAADVPGENDVGVARRDEPLFPRVAQYVGHPVAWVLARDPWQARDAARAVRAEYEPRAAVLSLDDALAQDSWLTDPQQITSGDPAAALRDAPRRLTGALRVGGQEHFYLEPQSALALPDEAGGVLVHSSTQHPTETQTIVARVLGLAAHQVVCQSLRMGGAFGGKEVQANPFAAVAALAALRTGQPVCVRLTRDQDMQITGKRHPFWARYAVGFDDTGRLLALDVELISDGGYSLDLSDPVMGRALFHIDNCYRIRHLRVRGRVARTNHASNTAFRGFGGPQAMVVIEEVLDRVARHLGLAPREVRERNFYRPGDCTHYGQPIPDADRIQRVWREVLSDSGYTARVRQVRSFNAAHEHSKRGLAVTPVKFGISFTTASFNQAGALVLVYRDGSVQVNHGGTEMGQGLHTKIRAVAARALGVAPQAVRVMPTRTDKVPNTSATAASSGSDLNGAAVRRACEQLRERLADIAAALLRCQPGDVRFDEGRARGPAGEHSFREVVEAAYLARVPLFASAHYRTPGLQYDRDAGRGTPFHYFAYGAAVAEVEVDGFTGQYRVRRVDVVHDVGESLAPSVDRGQIEGGLMQGIGWLTSEELVWDDDGALQVRGPSTYKLPCAVDCPPVLRVRTLERAAQPGVIYGSKAVGEPPFMLAIAVREALREAVAAFGARGEVALACPATPEQVYWAIEQARP